tara:strand:- start:2445 stop:2738 length:294 start_codon:yes stop_codon:yes gene_type:complete
MPYYPMKNFKFVRFEKSNTRFKKYDAIIQNKVLKTLHRIPFGDNRYFHFFDKTPLNIYSHLNHYDKDRKRRFLARHKRYLEIGYYSPVWFSINYLWK